MSDRIEKQIQLNAPQSRVWSALTDYRQFGAWFGVALTSPFAEGKPSSGFVGMKGYEHLTLEVVVKTITPERYFAFTWHPYALDQTVDYRKETPTLVEFTLEPRDNGTLLKVVESGFDKVPAARRAEAFRMNENGWQQQTVRIERYLAANP